MGALRELDKISYPLQNGCVFAAREISPNAGLEKGAIPMRAPSEGIVKSRAMAALIGLVLAAGVIGGIVSIVWPGSQTASGAGNTTVGEWRFDEGSGTTVDDSSSYGNDGAVYDAEWVQGISGNALHFNGTDGSYVEVPNKPELSPSRQVIIDVWIKPDSYPPPGVGSAVVWKGDPEDTTGCHGNRSYTLWLLGSGDLVFSSVPEDETCQRLYYTPTGLIPLNEWSHVRVDLNTWEGKVRIFVNDDLVMQDSYPQEPIKAGNSPLRIGGLFRSYWNQLHFSGSIDEVKIEGDAAPVGGIAELPQMSDSPAANYTALAALASLVAVALTAGAWYARRRWLG